MMKTNTIHTRAGAALLAVLACSTLGLAACGGGSGSSQQAYCDKVKNLGDFESKLNTADSSDPKAAAKLFTDLSTSMTDIAKSAPSDIKGEWDKISSVFGEISTAMKPLAELDLSDPSKIDPKTLENLQAIAPKMAALQETMKSSGDAIDVYTKDKCGFSIGK
jgi:hypothetical protein